MQLIKRVLLHISYSIIGIQKSIKIREFIRGLYRYPKSMIGRNLSIDNMEQTDVLVFAAHPDDEVIGLSAMIGRHCSQGENVTIIYVTDGTGRDGDSWKREKKLSEQIAEIRYQEGVRGLSVLRLPQQNVCCLGFPDGGTHRYLKQISEDVAMLIENSAPKTVYVHCIEGGHNDHDLVSVVVKSVCNKLNFQHVFEWAEYSLLYPQGTEEMKFLPSFSFHNTKEIKVQLSQKELANKKKMLAFHDSQDVADLFIHGEIFRKADLNHLNEELDAYSQIRKEDWSYLVEKYLNSMNSKNQHIIIKPNRPRKKDVKGT